MEFAAFDTVSEPPAEREVPQALVGRPFIGVHYRCCGVYSRVYINRRGTAYEGRCPKCARSIRIKIDPRGTDCRFFEAL